MLFKAMIPWYTEQNPHPLPFCPWSLPATSSWVKKQHHCRAQPPWESQWSHGKSCRVARPRCRWVRAPPCFEQEEAEPVERHPKKGRAREGGSYPRGPPATHPYSQALQPAVKTGMKPCAKLARVAAGGITRMDGGVFPPAIKAYQGKTDSD